MKNSFLTWKEWFYMKKSIVKWYFRTFRNKSRFQDWEVMGEVRIKPKKKGMLITGITAHEGGQLIVE